MGLRPGLPSGACIWFPVAVLLKVPLPCAATLAFLPAIAPCTPHRFKHAESSASFCCLPSKYFRHISGYPKRIKEKSVLCLLQLLSLFTVEAVTSPVGYVYLHHYLYSTALSMYLYRPTKRGSEKSSKPKQGRNFYLSGSL